MPIIIIKSMREGDEGYAEGWLGLMTELDFGKGVI